jgi:electron transport complex protein RnfD
LKQEAVLAESREDALQRDSVPSVSRDIRQANGIFIALIPVMLMAVYYYGGRVLALCGAAAGTAVLTDFACRLLQRRENRTPYDLSAANTGVILAMLLPASAPYWLAAIGAFTAIAVVRYPFGGHSGTLFHPANTAFAFLLICWTELVTRYPLPRQTLSYDSDPNVTLYTSPAARLMAGGAERIDWLDLLMGNFVGPMGCTSILILFFCGLFLALRGSIYWQIPTAVCGIVTLFAWFFPRVNSSHFSSVTLELAAGSLLFSLVFIASADNGEIRTGLGKWICGVILGGIIVLFRVLSRIEMVVPFAVIVLNTIDHRCDRYGEMLAGTAKALARAAWKFLRKGFAALWRGVRRLSSFLWDKLSELLQKLVG